MANTCHDSGFWEEEGADEVQQGDGTVDIKEKYASLVEEATIIRQSGKANYNTSPTEPDAWSVPVSPDSVPLVRQTEKFYMTNFGSIRLDDMNSLEGMVDKGGKDFASVTSTSLESIVKGEVQFKDSEAPKLDPKEDVSVLSEAIEEEVEEDFVIEAAGQENFVEEYFFKNPIENVAPVESTSYTAPEDLSEVDKMYFKSSERIEESIKSVSRPLDTDSLKEMNVVDEYYFGNVNGGTGAQNILSDSGLESMASEETEVSSGSVKRTQYPDSNESSEKPRHDTAKESQLSSKKTDLGSTLSGGSYQTVNKIDPNLLKGSESFGKGQAVVSKGASKTPHSNTEFYNVSEPKTAYDHVMRFRTAQKVSGEKIEMKTVLEGGEDIERLMELSSEGVDQNGVRDFRKLWQNLRDKPREIVISVLKESIIYKGDDFIILNKPYGMAVHGTAGNESDLALVKYLDELAKMLKVEKLYTVHRLDRNTTGGLLLAKTQQAAKMYHDMLQEGTIVKRYMAITKGVPNLPSGSIEIPMRDVVVDGRERMGLQPLLPGSKKPNIKTYDAVTNYKVLSQSRANSTALLLIRPETGIKHQIRVHLALGLGCPILGDHKYAHENSFAPQRLSEDVLKDLKIRQQKVRDMPMFLHACQLSFPEMGENGWDLNIKIPPPSLFRKVVKWLSLRRV